MGWDEKSWVGRVGVARDRSHSMADIDRWNDEDEWSAGRDGTEVLADWLVASHALACDWRWAEAGRKGRREKFIINKKRWIGG